MKKIIVLLVTVALSLILLTACGGGSDGDELLVTPDEIFEYLNESDLLPIMLDIREDRLSDYKVNPDDAVNFVAKEAAISATFVQLIIIEAKDGRVDDVYNEMLEHRSKLIDSAFYPQGLEAAANSIVNTYGNLVYLICDTEAVKIEEELLKFVS